MLLEDAGGAARLLRFADLSPVSDEVEVKGVVDCRGEQCFQDPVGLLAGGLGRDKAQAAAHPVDVGVHREGGLAQGEKEHDGGGLGTDAI